MEPVKSLLLTMSSLDPHLIPKTMFSFRNPFLYGFYLNSFATTDTNKDQFGALCKVGPKIPNTISIDFKHKQGSVFNHVVSPPLYIIELTIQIKIKI